jgi:hypothetical protein
MVECSTSTANVRPPVPPLPGGYEVIAARFERPQL